MSARASAAVSAPDHARPARSRSARRPPTPKRTPRRGRALADSSTSATATTRDDDDDRQHGTTSWPRNRRSRPSATQLRSCRIQNDQPHEREHDARPRTARPRAADAAGSVGRPGQDRRDEHDGTHRRATRAAPLRHCPSSATIRLRRSLGATIRSRRRRNFSYGDSDNPRATGRRIARMSEIAPAHAHVNCSGSTGCTPAPPAEPGARSARRDPAWSRPRGQRGRGARHHGSQRVRQEHARQHAARLARVRGHRRHDHVPRRRRDRLAGRRARQGRDVPRLPVPAGDPRRLGHPVPPPGTVGAQGHRPLGARAAAGDDGVDEAARHRFVVRRPLPQRGLLGRREEAQRDHADGDPRAGAGDPRRDRLRARHRRPARRRPRHP